MRYPTSEIRHFFFPPVYCTFGRITKVKVKPMENFSRKPSCAAEFFGSPQASFRWLTRCTHLLFYFETRASSLTTHPHVPHPPHQCRTERVSAISQHVREDLPRPRAAVRPRAGDQAGGRNGLVSVGRRLGQPVLALGLQSKDLPTGIRRGECAGQALRSRDWRVGLAVGWLRRGEGEQARSCQGVWQPFYHFGPFFSSF